MKYMGWSYSDLRDCPAWLVRLIPEYAKEEAKEAKRRSREQQNSIRRR